MSMLSIYTINYLSLVPRPLPDFISQPYAEKNWVFLHGCEIKSGSRVAWGRGYNYLQLLTTMNYPARAHTINLGYTGDESLKIFWKPCTWTLLISSSLWKEEMSLGMRLLVAPVPASQIKGRYKWIRNKDEPQGKV